MYSFTDFISFDSNVMRKVKICKRIKNDFFLFKQGRDPNKGATFKQRFESNEMKFVNN